MGLQVSPGPFGVSRCPGAPLAWACLPKQGRGAPWRGGCSERVQAPGLTGVREVKGSCLHLPGLTSQRARIC